MCGRPSSELAVNIQAQESSRVAARVQEWGEGGLKERAHIVEEACQQNEACVTFMQQTYIRL